MVRRSRGGAGLDAGRHATREMEGPDELATNDYFIALHEPLKDDHEEL